MVMKKYLYLMISGVIAISCAKEIDPTVSTPGASGERQEITFNAGNSQTKTTLSEGTAVLWAAQDALTVFDTELANNKFTQSSLSDDYASASFTGEAAVSDTYYAVYPYRAGNASASAGVISTYLSPDQFAVANSFGQGANLSMGVSSTVDGENSFVMQQVGAFIKFSFSGCSNVTSICLKAIGGEKISGGVTATCTEGVFNAVSTNDGSALDEVTLYPAAGSEYIAEGTYYAVVLPVTLNSGLQFIFTEKTDGVEKVISAKVDSSIELAKNTVSAIPSTINLPDVSNPAWMEQETVSALFKAPEYLMNNQEGEIVWPFNETKPNSNLNGTTNFTTINGNYTIGINFGTKKLNQYVSGTGVSSGSCSNWGLFFPAIEGKKIVKVEYYTATPDQTGNPRICTANGTTATIDGTANTALSAYSKYVWNIGSIDANKGFSVRYSGTEDVGKTAVYMMGFRAVYRNAEGPSKAVVSTSTNVSGPTLNQNVELRGSFVPYDGTVNGYSYGFEYKEITNAVMSRSSAAEPFKGGNSYTLRSAQSGEWTNVDAMIESGTSFIAEVNTLTRGQSYVVRAWARVGQDDEKVYGEEKTITLLGAATSGKKWQYGDGEFFTIWKALSRTESESYHYHWETRLTTESYTYGEDCILYEAEVGSKPEFYNKEYLKFTKGQKFSFVSGESGTARISMVCKTTASDARTIYVSVNDESATSFDSSLGTETVTSPDFAINEGDKISITISNNANLTMISYECASQTASFVPSVDKESSNNSENVYNFAVNASDDVAWTAEVSAGAGEGVVLSKTSGVGNDSFTLTVPVNYSFDTDVPYTVTVLTDDSRIVEGNRERNFELVQGKLTEVIFGCKWGYDFMSAWNEAGFVASTPFTGHLVTANTPKAISAYKSASAGWIRGNFSFEFTVGEAGTGNLSFNAKIGSGKSLKVYQNGTSVYSYTGTGSAVQHSVELTVVKGDLIKIAASGSNDNNYIYLNETYYVVWDRVE